MYEKHGAKVQILGENASVNICEKLKTNGFYRRIAGFYRRNFFRFELLTFEPKIEGLKFCRIMVLM